MADRITPPAPLPSPSEPTRPAVFLAGSIDQGRAEPWQARVLAGLADLDLWVLDPRRDEWDASWPQDPAFAPFREQVEWELEGLARADLVAMYLAPASLAPISLLELGLTAASGRLVVACPEAFWRRGNVRIVCERFGVPCLDTLDALVAAVRARLAR